jgi:hypothetical protein
MKFVFRLILQLWRWIASWFRVAPRPRQTVYLEELPEMLNANAVYVLGEGSHRWFVAMKCPCGCGELVQVSLLPDAKPRWRLVEHPDGTISLAPSVWRKVGCRSHFFLRCGLIQWCGASNPP